MIYLTNHALERDYNDKVEEGDIIRFMEKLIKLYDLTKKDNGFYKFRDNKLTLVLKRRDEDFILITLYSKHYVMLNYDVAEFKCFFEGTEPDERLHVELDKPKTDRNTNNSTFRKIFKENVYEGCVPKKKPVVKHRPGLKIKKKVK